MELNKFSAEGGLLEAAGRHEPGKLPNDFFCDRLACYGAVQFAGLVDSNGVIRDLRVVRNTWEYTPGYHARISEKTVYSWRYRPPKVHGHSVCVKMGWNLDFRAGNKKVEQ